eukprot:g19750.t1
MFGCVCVSSMMDAPFPNLVDMGRGLWSGLGSLAFSRDPTPLCALALATAQELAMWFLASWVWWWWSCLWLPQLAVVYLAPTLLAPCLSLLNACLAVLLRWLPTFWRRPLLRQRVVIVGAGFAGAAAQRTLCDAGFQDVTLVDYKDYLEYTPGVLRLYVEPEHVHELVRPVPQTRARLVVGTATHVDQQRVTVHTQDGIKLVPYDFLILAPGASYPQAPIKATKAEPTVQARAATWRAAAQRLREARSVLVLGGGPVGVELAAEIATSRQHAHCRVTLLHGHKELCNAFPLPSRQYTAKQLARAGVELVLGVRVTSVDHDERTCQLQDGRTLGPFDIIYTCFGCSRDPLGLTFTGKLGAFSQDEVLDESKSVLDTSRATLRPSHFLPAPAQPVQRAAAPSAAASPAHLKVNQFLQLLSPSGEAVENIFALGDAMVISDASKSGELKLGHTAELNAHLAAHNIVQLALHQEATAPAAPAPALHKYPEDL